MIYYITNNLIDEHFHNHISQGIQEYTGKEVSHIHLVDVTNYDIMIEYLSLTEKLKPQDNVLIHNVDNRRVNYVSLHNDRGIIKNTAKNISSHNSEIIEIKKKYHREESILLYKLFFDIILSTNKLTQSRTMIIPNYKIDFIDYEPKFIMPCNPYEDFFGLLFSKNILFYKDMQYTKENIEEIVKVIYSETLHED